MEASARQPSRTGRLAGAGARSTPPAGAARRRPRPIPPIPESLLQDAALNADIALLPANYSFEVHKTVHRVRCLNARRVALQLPEGLLLYASVLADVLRAHCHGAETVVLGDVTYGACCVDDLAAKALGADLLVHYGHSCLVPVQKCVIPMLYVFVHIRFDASHLLRCLKDTFPLPAKAVGGSIGGDTETGVQEGDEKAISGHLQGEEDSNVAQSVGDAETAANGLPSARSPRLALLGTIQFVDTLHAIRDQVAAHFGAENILIPQARPLSPGELLGCTSPRFSESIDALVYVADGRFHLESAMIANPTLPAYRYDPYSKAFSRERYAHETMLRARRAAVERARGARRFGIILGTLGRQGSPAVLRRVQEAVRGAGRSAVVVLLSEITPDKVRRMEAAGVVEAWVQIACPRLSIDWGDGYGEKPLLTPYEAFVAVGKEQWREKYPMDFYAKDGGQWSNYYKEKKMTPAVG